MVDITIVVVGILYVTRKEKTKQISEDSRRTLLFSTPKTHLKIPSELSNWQSHGGIQTRNTGRWFQHSFVRKRSPTPLPWLNCESDAVVLMRHFNVNLSLRF